MKRNIVSGLLILIVVIVFFVFIWRSIPTLQRRPPETRLGNTVFLPDTLPKEYATLFNTQQLNHITVSSITYNEGDFPICIISLMDKYDVIILKKRNRYRSFPIKKIPEIRAFFKNQLYK